MRWSWLTVVFGVLATGGILSEALAGQCGAITQVTGDGQIVRNGQTLPATVGTPIEEGDVLRAPKGSAIDFSVNGVAGLSAAEGTEVEVTKAAENEMKLDLMLGELRANIKSLPHSSSFSVETPTAIAAVRGTQFLSRVFLNEQNLPDSSFVVRDSFVDVTFKKSGEVFQLKQGQAIDVPSIPAAGSPQLRSASNSEVVKMEGASQIIACA